MSQVVATGSIQNTLLSLDSGSAHERAQKLLKPATFSSMVFHSEGNKCSKIEEHLKHLRGVQQFGDASAGIWSKRTFRRKTKIVCTIGPSTNTKEMIWNLAEAEMNVARLNMSHGDHASHQKVIDLVEEYNAQTKDNVIAIMLDTKVQGTCSSYPEGTYPWVMLSDTTGEVDNYCVLALGNNGHCVWTYVLRTTTSYSSCTRPTSKILGFISL
ncbi:unnamed protein product [Lupinus luteus]|uniref:pyruvate kinase n=1 Tax=Lupinus luteus TaxID=3873 RepID=A0AAV1Y3L6_LUPLU